jgi:hypothetical protein
MNWRGEKGLSIRKALNLAWLSDIFICVKAITKRQFMRKPGILSKLQPGESVQIDSSPPLVVSRRKERQLTPQQMASELDKLASKCPPIDTLAVLKDLRR